MQLHVDDGQEIRLQWNQDLSERVILLYADPNPTSNSTNFVLAVDRSGQGYSLNLESGNVEKLFSMNVGSLEHVIHTPDGLLYRASDGEIGIYDIRNRSVKYSWAGTEGDALRVHAFQRNAPLIAVETRFFKIDLKSRNPKAQHVRLKGFENTSGVTFTGHSRGGALLFFGFRDGSVLICSAHNIKPLFNLRDADGPISGFLIIPTISVGVASTAHGKLTFWDLQTGAILEELSAHRENILSLSSNINGRFLLTAGMDSQVRLWETSWTASETEGEPALAWMSAEKKSGTSALSRLFGFRNR